MRRTLERLKRLERGRAEERGPLCIVFEGTEGGGPCVAMLGAGRGGQAMQLRRDGDETGEAFLARVERERARIAG